MCLLLNSILLYNLAPSKKHSFPQNTRTPLRCKSDVAAFSKVYRQLIFDAPSPVAISVSLAVGDEFWFRYNILFGENKARKYLGEASK